MAATRPATLCWVVLALAATAEAQSFGKFCRSAGKPFRPTKFKARLNDANGKRVGVSRYCWVGTGSTGYSRNTVTRRGTNQLTSVNYYEGPTTSNITATPLQPTPTPSGGRIDIITQVNGIQVTACSETMSAGLVIGGSKISPPTQMKRYSGPACSP